MKPDYTRCVYNLTQSRNDETRVKIDTLSYLDLVRSLAAIAVFIFHLRALFFQEYARVQPDLLGRLFYFFTSFGHQAVVVFFVLSGFLIIQSVHRSHSTGKWSITNYAISRLSRLWIVLIPALVLTLVWDFTGTALFPNSLFHQGQLPPLVTIPTAELISPTIFLGNLFFVNTIWVPCLGSNNPLWSLANEFWYYAIFPLLYFAWVQRYPWPTRLLLAVLAVGLLIGVGPAIALSFPIWLLGGVAIWLMRDRRVKAVLARPWGLAGTLLLFGGLLTLIRLGKYPHLANDYSLGVATMLLVVALTYRATLPGAIASLAKRFSDISYTFYLVHVPFSVFLTAWLVPVRRDWNLENLLLFIGLAVVNIFYALLCWYLFERHTLRLKSWLMQGWLTVKI